MILELMYAPASVENLATLSEFTQGYQRSVEKVSVALTAWALQPSRFRKNTLSAKIDQLEN
jgi:hypothetical protein